MSEKDINLRLIEIAAEIFEVDTAGLTLEDSAETIEEWDSLAHLRLFLEIQSEFSISFTTDEIQELRCLREIADIITKRI